MVDDGEWAGVPIGGLGTGSIGRTFRGDAARWHLEVGQHRFEPVAADGFSPCVGLARGRRRGVGQAGAAVRWRPRDRLSALRPTHLPAWGWDLPVVGGTYHALFPRAWQTFEPEGLGLPGVRHVASSCPPSSPATSSGARCPSGSSSGGWRIPGPTR